MLVSWCIQSPLFSRSYYILLYIGKFESEESGRAPHYIQNLTYIASFIDYHFPQFMRLFQIGKLSLSFFFPFLFRIECVLTPKIHNWFYIFEFCVKYWTSQYANRFEKQAF